MGFMSLPKRKILSFIYLLTSNPWKGWGYLESMRVAQPIVNFLHGVLEVGIHSCHRIAFVLSLHRGKSAFREASRVAASRHEKEVI